MAGRPRKTSIIKDIDEISVPETIEKVETKVESEPVVEKAPEPSIDNTVTVKLNSPSDWLNVRSGPSTNDSIIGTLKDGAKVTVYETKKNWGKISETEEKWVLLDFVV